MPGEEKDYDPAEARLYRLPDDIADQHGVPRFDDAAERDAVIKAQKISEEAPSEPHGPSDVIETPRPTNEQLDAARQLEARAAVEAADPDRKAGGPRQAPSVSYEAGAGVAGAVNPLEGNPLYLDPNAPSDGRERVVVPNDIAEQAKRNEAIITPKADLIDADSANPHAEGSPDNVYGPDPRLKRPPLSGPSGER